MLTWLLVAVAHAEEAASGFTLREIWDHSGLLAKGVIVTLVAMMVGALLVGIERTLAFRQSTQRSRALAAAIVPSLSKNDVSGALKIAEDEAYKGAYLGVLLKAGLAEIALRADQHGIENAERAVAKVIGQEVARMKRGMGILATTGSTAPFVGLFGTTFGVINAFQGMATAGSGLASISAGISEALITTGVGIGVAVVGVWMFNYFTNRIEKIQEELVSSEADFLGWAAKLVQARGGASAAK
jgi:biopolymer transport protein ExbB/biopolymer transport protein TolQ